MIPSLKGLLFFSFLFNFFFLNKFAFHFCFLSFLFWCDEFICVGGVVVASVRDREDKRLKKL